MASGKSFAETDSWAVAIAFIVFAFLSVLIDKAVRWLKHTLHAKPTLLKVVHKAEGELFLLGSVSLILLVFEDILVEHTCVKSSRFNGEEWAMCPYASISGSTRRRNLKASYEDESSCDDDAEPFLSRAVLHQVHLFLFFLALAHVCYTTATLALGRRRLRKMMRKRNRHIEKTMMKVSQLTSTDAHVLVDRMISRQSVLRPKGIDDADADGDGNANESRGASSDARPEPEPEESGETRRPPSSYAETDASLKGEGSVENITRLAADALRGDGVALARRRDHFRDGLSRSSKRLFDNRAAGDGDGVFSAFGLKRLALTETFVAERLGARLPEATLIRFELHFLRQHNVRSLKFDFPEYVLACVDWDSSDTLGMSPGRWSIATVIILLMGPYENINLLVSFVSLITLLGLAMWLKSRVDYVLMTEKTGGFVSDASLFLLSKPRLVKDAFVAILYQQSFHVASWIFGMWQVGVGERYGCYYGETWSVAVSGITVLISLVVGGYIILPLDALVSQMSGQFRSELLDPDVAAAVTRLAATLERRRRRRRFATKESAAIHIQRTFRQRKRINLDRAAKVALLRAANGERVDSPSTEYARSRFAEGRGRSFSGSAAEEARADARDDGHPKP